MRRSVQAVIALGLLIATSVMAQSPVGTKVAARKSGFDFMQPATQALQKDDSQNPAMLWVKDGQIAWSNKDGAAQKSCTDCHGNITQMRGVAARYPAASNTQQRVVTLNEQINFCRVDAQKSKPWPPENATLLGLEAAIALQSRGRPISPGKDAPLVAAQQRGEALFKQRIGQMDLSCRDCHDLLAGKRLGGNLIPQGHATGYPIYRLEWQSVGSLQRRLRGCMAAVRAEPYPYGGSELVDLEAFLMTRAAGMKLESPGVRP